MCVRGTHFLFTSTKPPIYSSVLISDAHFYHVFQVIWFPGPCITSSRYTSRTRATGRRSTRRAAPRSTGNPKRFTPSATSCTAHRWSGRTPTWSRPKSPYKPRGETQSYVWILDYEGLLRLMRGGCTNTLFLFPIRCRYLMFNVSQYRKTVLT